MAWAASRAASGRNAWRALQRLLCTTSRGSDPDVVVVGGGHNGLIAAALLARQGFEVDVFEAADVVGGACRTEFPFEKVPGLGQSTGAYLLGVMPPELIQTLGVNIPTVRRDPHYFLPTTGDKYLLMGSDEVDTRRQFEDFFSRQDWLANGHMLAELAAIRDDVAPAVLAEPLSVEETAERHVRPELRQAFVNLVQKPVIDYIDRFGFQSELLRAMYAVTDGVVGIAGSWDSPGSGANFLAHNMCRLPGSDGTWMVVQGGMGAVSQQLAVAALKAGAYIHTAHPVQSVTLKEGSATGVILKDGTEVKAKAVLVNADPFRLRQLVGPQAFPTGFNAKLDAMRRPGTSLKLNLALKGLPRFSCLPEQRGQHRTTTHLLPPEGQVFDTLGKAYQDVQAGKLPEFPAIEWYIHTTVDDTLCDAEGHHSSALFVQWVPYELEGGKRWEEQERSFAKHLLSIADQFAPGTSDLVVDTFMLTPKKIESHFGITGGHIHHIDNSFAFDQRFPYATPVPGLYSASSGCHPAGSVMGAAGHNAAARLVRDMGMTPCWMGGEKLRKRANAHVTF